MSTGTPRDGTRGTHYLVTGASGFLGRHLLEAESASAAAAPMLALVRDRGAWQRYAWTRRLARVDVIEAELAGAGALDASLPPLRGIYHLAALVRHSRRGSAEVQRTNVEGALHMVRLAARHGCRLVIASTSGTVACFERADVWADEDSPYCLETVADWPYYRSKIEMEQRATALAAELGVDLVRVRPPVLLGPGDHRLRSTAIVRRAIRGEFAFVVRGGMHFSDVRDAAQALRRAMLRREARPVYHLDGTACSLAEFFAMLAALSGRPAPRRTLPYALAWGLASANAQLERWLRGARIFPLPDPVVVEMASHHWGMRSRYAAADLGYASRDPRETLRDTIAWLRSHDASLA
ncbi:MAG: NAD-dependent epimerase/dehydratase family protein [Myxococcales bacterium]|nr:NAD-dependent epimerase/dehydratase family protein [Myxococcales bacterium]MDH5306264.1 NAD-dependent epimerase/dehydratase family protein [Myxococcales bacterium]MDH5566233.1 NAD-dependent epimerase/dehydratase family protein [Myxococcales bacterium]